MFGNPHTAISFTMTSKANTKNNDNGCGKHGNMMGQREKERRDWPTFSGKNPNSFRIETISLRLITNPMDKPD